MDNNENLKLKPIKKQRVTLTIKSTSPMIQHNWDEKAARMMLERKQGRKTKDREDCDPEAEFKAAMYLTADGKHAIPGMALKSAIISAAHKDVGIEKTWVRKALFLVCAPDMMIPIQCDPPRMRQDHVKVGMSSADLRFRPEFATWSADVTFEIDAELLRVEDLLNLIDRAGVGTGIGDWRPEKDGEHGRFCVDQDRPVRVE